MNESTTSSDPLPVVLSRHVCWHVNLGCSLTPCSPASLNIDLWTDLWCPQGASSRLQLQHSHLLDSTARVWKFTAAFCGDGEHGVMLRVARIEPQSPVEADGGAAGGAPGQHRRQRRHHGAIPAAHQRQGGPRRWVSSTGLHMLLIHPAGWELRLLLHPRITEGLPMAPPFRNTQNKGSDRPELL